MCNPFVSIVVTTYNRKELLKETIDSILDQTYSNFELIIVDNYSNYDFFSFINSFHSDKIRAFQNKNNGLIAVNRNYGIEKANGKYIAFSDDDDLWLKEKLEKQVEVLQKENVDFISTGLIYFGNDMDDTYRSRVYSSKSEIYRKNYIATSTVLARKSDVLRFDINPKFNYAEDWACWIKLVLNGYTLYQMPEAYVRYRVFTTNSTNQNKVQPNKKGIWILNHMKKEYGLSFNTIDYIMSISYHAILYLAKKILRRK